MPRPSIALLLILCALTAAHDVQAAAPCTMKRYASVHVDIRDDGAVLLPVMVSGKSAWAMLDMAGGLPLVFEKSAEFLGLRTAAATEFDAMIGGRKIERRAIVDSLIIGGANFTKWDMYVVPSSDGQMPVHRGQPLLGSLSSRFMTAVDLEMDLGNGQIGIFEQNRCGNRVVYWGSEFTTADLYHDASGLMVFPMEIDGKRVEAALNTQSRTSLLSEAVTSKFFGFDRDSEGISRVTSPDGHDVASYRAMSLTAKGLQMNNVRIRLRDDKDRKCQPTSLERNTRAIGFSGCLSVAPLSVGTDLLRKLRIYVAPRQGKIYFTRAIDEAPEPDPSPIAP